MAIGTKGIPFYVEWIRYRPGIGKRIQFHLGEYGRKSLGWKWVPGDAKVTRARAALVALTMLGEKAEPAIPLFVEMATNVGVLPPKPYSLNEPISGYVGLANIGRAAVP